MIPSLTLGLLQDQCERGPISLYLARVVFWPFFVNAHQKQSGNLLKLLICFVFVRKWGQASCQIGCHNQVLLEKVMFFDANSGHRITMVNSYKDFFNYFITGAKLDLVLDVIGDKRPTTWWEGIHMCMTLLCSSLRVGLFTSTITIIPVHRLF